jgi:hypothetical protein
MMALAASLAPGRSRIPVRQPKQRRNSLAIYFVTLVVIGLMLAPVA